MNTLVTTLNGELRTNSVILAEGTDNSHAAVIKLCRKYQNDLAEFGRVEFEIQPFVTSGGIQKRDVCSLNEDQAMLLITYLRNNDIVRSFKIALVKAFSELRATHHRAIMLNDPVQLQQILLNYTTKLIEQEAQLKQAAPAVEFVDRFVNATGTKSFREVAKLLAANENEFREFLISKNIMYRLGGTLTPRSEHITAGRFAIKAGVANNDHAYTQARFTTKGIKFVAGEWATYKNQHGALLC